jgi:hypothetical protein
MNPWWLAFCSATILAVAGVLIALNLVQAIRSGVLYGDRVGNESMTAYRARQPVQYWILVFVRLLIALGFLSFAGTMFFHLAT